MTQIYTVVVTTPQQHLEFLGHFIAGQPCPVCAEQQGTYIQSTKCTSPKAHAEQTQQTYNRDGNTTATMSHSYRQKVTHQLYRKADFAVRETFGLHGK